MQNKIITAALLCVLGATTIFAQSPIEIKGKVKFTNPDFTVKLLSRDGQDVTTIAECPVKDDNTYVLNVPAVKPGAYTLDCGRWQSVRVWVEDENLEVDFRGVDTAKIKIKNPPYVYIKGGKKNEVMNMLNFNGYRNYQSMIAISQATYRTKMEDEDKQKLSMSLYDMNGDDTNARTRYIAEHYADRTSVMAAVASLNPEKDAKLIESTLSTLEAAHPGYPLINEYRMAVKKQKEQRERIAIGKPAPEFSYPDVKGKKKYGPKSFKGKVLVIDFWASWCGPCRGEIPGMKEVYAELKAKGAEFLSVSIDKRDADWLKAVKEEAMPWPQAHATDAGKQLMEDYQFSGIPHIIVLDKDGNFYARNVRGKRIKEAVENALNGVPATKPAPKKSISAGGMMMSM